MFNNIICQDRAINLLTNAIKTDRLAQAYIFYGPDGTGKLLTAFTLAKKLNCLKVENEISKTQIAKSDICNCNSCLKITHFQHPDVKFVFPIPNYDLDENGVVKKETEWEEYHKYIESKKQTPWKDYHFDKVTAIRIEQIRALQRDISMSRHEGLKKIYIFENFDKITISAANAFLKTLEEPPIDTHFILTCTNLNKLLPTILSRCSKVEFREISADKIEEYLNNEQRALSFEQSRLYSRLAKGSLEKAVCLSQDENLETLDITIKFLRIALEKDDLGFIEWIERHFAKGTRNVYLFEDFIQYLQLWIHDLEIYKLNPDKITFVNQQNLLEKFLSMNYSALEKVLGLDDYLEKYRGNVNVRLILAQIYGCLTAY